MICLLRFSPASAGKKNGRDRSPARLDRLFVDYLPVPDRFETCGLVAALSLTTNVPVAAPVCVGWKTTLMVQVEPAARLEPQVVAETENGPVVEGEMLVSATACLLWRVNVLAALVVPTVVLGKVALAGVKVTAMVPVPLSDTLCGLPPALSVMESVPVREPTWV